MITKLNQSIRSYYNINIKGVNLLGLSFCYFVLKKIFYNLLSVLLLMVVIKIFITDFEIVKILNNYISLNGFTLIHITFVLIFFLIICNWLLFKNEVNILNKIENNFLSRVKKNFKLKSNYRKDSILLRKAITTNADLIIIICLSLFLMINNFFIFFCISGLFFINFLFQINLINKDYPVTNAIKKIFKKYEQSIFDFKFINKNKKLINRLEKIRFTQFISEIFLIKAIILIFFLFDYYKLETSFILELVILTRFLYGHLKSFFSNTFVMSDIYKKNKNIDHDDGEIL
jgi:hypothetical protein